MKKPILEHLQNLPEEYREEAIRLHKESGWANDSFDKPSEALSCAFPWANLKDIVDISDVNLNEIDEIFNSGQKWANLYNELKSKGL